MPVIRLQKREANEEPVIQLKKEALVKDELPASSERPASSEQPASSDPRKRKADLSEVKEHAAKMKRELSEVKAESEYEGDDDDYMNQMAVSYAGGEYDEAAWYADKNVQSDPYL